MGWHTRCRHRRRRRLRGLLLLLRLLLATPIPAPAPIRVRGGGAPHVKLRNLLSVPTAGATASGGGGIGVGGGGGGGGGGGCVRGGLGREEAGGEAAAGAAPGLGLWCGKIDSVDRWRVDSGQDTPPNSEWIRVNVETRAIRASVSRNDNTSISTHLGREPAAFLRRPVEGADGALGVRGEEGDKCLQDQPHCGGVWVGGGKEDGCQWGRRWRVRTKSSTITYCVVTVARLTDVPPQAGCQCSGWCAEMERQIFFPTSNRPFGCRGGVF